MNCAGSVTFFLAMICSIAPYTIFSAAAFLPSVMIMFMNLVMTSDLNFGSGRILRCSGLRRRDMRGPLLLGGGAAAILGTLRAVLGAALTPLLDAAGVEGSANGVVANAGKVLHTAAADHDAGVLLEVVPFAADVGDDFEAVGETDLGDLAQSRVRLLRRGGVDAGTHAALLRTTGERRRLAFPDPFDTGAAHKLVDRWHEVDFPGFERTTGRPVGRPVTEGRALWAGPFVMSTVFSGAT